MRKQIKKTILTSVVMFFALTASQAQSSGTLPQFTVSAGDGTSVSSSSLTQSQAQNQNWLLIYIQPNCSTCEAVLSRLSSDLPQLPARAVVIVGNAQASDLSTFAAAHPSWSAAQWYADTSGSAYSALQFTGTPVIAGVQANTMVWNLTGTACLSSSDNAFANWIQ